MPFSELSDDEFEVFCFLLLKTENPRDQIYYYGKTADAGRDIVHRLPDDTLRLIQCKRYAENVHIGVIRAELAKLYCNVFNGVIPERPDDVIFYVAPDLTSPAADLLDDQQEWRSCARDELARHLHGEPSPELLEFARSWWPRWDRENAVCLTQRCKKLPDLRDEFFAVKKVIDASREEMRQDMLEVVRGCFDEAKKMESAPLGSPVLEEEALDQSQVASAFEKASRALLRWPTTLGNDVCLLRPELRHLLEVIDSQDASTTALLGTPGSGKSALLAMLGTAAAQRGFPVLAVKADNLRVSVDSQARLCQALRLPALPALCVRALATSQKVLILLDQLDALADLVDLKSQRLNVLVELIAELHGLRNVYVVCSCRQFEFRHDARLAAIEADELALSLPSWDHVSAVLKAHGVEASHWPEPLRESLRPPQHLKVFLQRLRGTSEDLIFRSYQQMLDDLWDQRVVNPDGPLGRSDLLMDMAEIMAQEEVMWLPAARFEERQALVQTLERAGILTRPDDGPRIGFQHQTLFEHAQARAFARRPGGLASHVLERQDGLFVRPTLWSSLNYLRGAAPKAYASEVSTLCASRLRLHVKYLLIEFFGQLTDPTDEEETWMAAWLDDPEYRPKALNSMRRNARWFTRVKNRRLPEVMRLPQDQAWPVVQVLTDAWPFAPEDCLELIKSVWLDDPERDTLILSTLRDVHDWSEDAVDVACRVVRRTDVHDGFIMMFADAIAERSPRLAPSLVAVHLMRALKKLEAAPDPAPDPLAENATDVDRIVQQVTFRPKRRFQKLLENRSSLHDLANLAEKAPKEFLDELWPWFVRTIAHVLDPPHHILRTYRHDQCLACTLDPEDRPHYPVFAAMETAIRCLAKSHLEGFLRFAREWSDYDALVVQRLLCRGFSEVVHVVPDAALEFLVSDPRRLILGNHDDHSGDTRVLIAEVAPHLDDSQVLRLEQAILTWSEYQPDLADEDAETRSLRRKWDRAKRLRVLKAIPLDRLSPPTRALVLSEEESLREYAKDDAMARGMRLVGSPMSAEQMSLASDDNIMGLFQELEDSTEAHHPRDWMRGGSVQASDALGEFAKRCPQRAAGLLPRFVPTKQERPAGAIIRALSETSFPSRDLFDLILGLDRRGFAGNDFRDDAAYACATRAATEKNLPDVICDLLTRWLAAWTGPGHDYSRDEDRAEGQDAKPRSVLWQTSGMVTLPHGTYWMLRALTHAYLRREPPDAERWLGVLEQHVEREDTVHLWRVLCEDLQYLSFCDKARVCQFLKRLLERYPRVRDSRFGLLLLARLRRFLPLHVYRSFLNDIRCAGWEFGPQGYGELTALSFLADEEAAWARSAAEAFLPGYRRPAALVRRFLRPLLRNVAAGFLRMLEKLGIKTGSGNRLRRIDEVGRIRLGMAFAAANLWQESKCRGKATEILVRLAPVAKGDLAAAMMTTFFLADELYPESCTLRLLQAVLANKELLLAEHDNSVVEKLSDVLSVNRELVCGICEAVVAFHGKDLTDIRTRFVLAAPHLTNLALTLQRAGGVYRDRGLRLFEKLLVLGVGDAQSVLDELDRRPRNIPRSAVGRRRRARR